MMTLLSLVLSMRIFPFRFLLCWILIPVLIGALVLPPRALCLTIGEERKIGHQLLFRIRAELAVLDDPDISRYINELGQEVLHTVGPQHFDYRFYVVRSDTFNAFAAPAGLVFFYSALIENMRSEDELVSVLAHEIGHVVSRHIAQRMEKGTKVNLASLLLGMAGLAMGVPGLSQGLLLGSMAAGATMSLQYSRENEEEADRLSYGWMRKMGRDPRAMEDMLQTMRRISRYHMSGSVPQYLLTHPHPEARMGYVQSLLERDRLNQVPAPERTDNFAFLRFRYRVMMQSGDPERVRIACINLLKRPADPETAEQHTMAHYGLALAETANRRFDQALEHLAQVRAQYPGEEILEVDRAVILIAAGRNREAREILRQAVQRDPSDMYAVYQLARVEQLAGDMQRAGQLLRRLAVAMPEFPGVYYELGRLAVDQGQESLAGFYLGKYQLYLGRFRLAIASLTKSSKDPGLSEAMRYEAKELLDELRELEIADPEKDRQQRT
ncbi:MAG: M48 family metalloprotease [Desulfobulbus sp.]|jgi:predicted Zn-dependent protease